MHTHVRACPWRAPLFVIPLLFVLSNSVFAQSVPSPWTARDIGAPTLTGLATYASGVFTIDGAGSDIWASSDQFYFVYQAVSGDVDISARLNSLDDVYSWTNAGVMIRSSLSASAAQAYTASTSANGLYFRRRLANGGMVTAVSGPESAAPIWVRLVRKGTLVTSYWSSNGTSWTTIGSSTIALGTTAYVGLAVTSHQVSTRATAVFSNVKITAPGSAPAGYQNQDIGAPAIKGSVSASSNVYTIKAAGRDIWDTSDQFHFMHKPITGNVDVIARVASITNADAWSKAGVMIRESLTAQSPHAMTVASVAKGYAFQRRPDTGVYSEHTAGGSGGPPGWVRLVRTGDLFESYRSTNGSTWTKIGSDTIAMSDTVYVGIAVTSHDVTTATTAVVDNLKITASAPSTNKPPAISITAPANGVQVTAPVTVTIAATVTDPEGRMASVDFYAGSTLLGRDTTAPYSYAWSAATAGTYSLKAVAHDADGGSTTSGAISVTVKAPTTTTPPRYVVFTRSADHATNVTRYVFKVFAAGANPATATPVATSDLGKPAPASNGDITVDRASFFNALAAGTYLGTVTAVGPAGQTPSAAVTFSR